MLAAAAHKQITVFAAVDAIHEMTEGSVFYALLDAVEEHVEELLGVLLSAHVDRIALEVFEGVAEVLRVVFLLLGQLEVGEH